MKFTHFSHNVQILPISQAVVPLSSVEYTYGFGVYESVRVTKGIVYFLEEHIVRLLESAKAITLGHQFTYADVEKAILDLVEQTEVETYNLKILLIGSSNPDAADLYVLCLNPLFPDRKLYRHGAGFITHEYERFFPQAKTLNMLPSYLAYRKAREQGAYDALLINRDGHITEGTRTNFMGIQDKTIFSPPEAGILLGVMRKVVLTVAARNGFTLVQRDISLADVSTFDGAFVTSTSSKIMPIGSIDGTVLGPPPSQLKMLMDATDAFIAGCGGRLGSA